ncbi:Pkinase-domain-containing protein [Gonapodya prolifera JEL478]|uniref:non-specific serine/threonine protein kinase n=1 Tax=Gonapodya prolifera (strain JEL478) TaxID=1344416 RepID=A0A139AHI7_GONPJ|nr:Pkinase-domain-containing protein [Gonapodya prolifera JEL478]|eukprot:KXS16024.1 Pkinase-domain-containing protein [Gonapodya prolifera JEL478]
MTADTDHLSDSSVGTLVDAPTHSNDSALAASDKTQSAAPSALQTPAATPSPHSQQHPSPSAAQATTRRPSAPPQLKPSLLHKLFHINDDAHASANQGPISPSPSHATSPSASEDEWHHPHPKPSEKRPSSGSLSVVEKLFSRSKPPASPVSPSNPNPPSTTSTPRPSNDSSYFPPHVSIHSATSTSSQQNGTVPRISTDGLSAPTPLPPGTGAALLREPRVPVPNAPSTPDPSLPLSPLSPISPVSPATPTTSPEGATSPSASASLKPPTAQDPPRARRRSFGRSPGRPASAHPSTPAHAPAQRTPSGVLGGSSDPLAALRRANAEASLSDRWGDVGDEIIGRGATSVVRLVRRRTASNGSSIAGVAGGAANGTANGKDAKQNGSRVPSGSNIAGAGAGDKEVDKDVFAVKEFRRRRKDESEREYVKKVTSEFCIGSSLRHPSIISTLDLLRTSHGWCEVLEYAPGGDLCALIQSGGLQYEVANGLWTQLVNGVAYMHGMGVAHRDLKPENLMLTPPLTLKITDFGSAEVFRTVWEATPHKSTRVAGSEPYIAPEEFTEKSFDPVQVDGWACGVIYLTMIYNRIPWRAATATDPNYKFYLRCRSRAVIAPAAESADTPGAGDATAAAPSSSPSTATTPGVPVVTTGFPMLDHLPPAPRWLVYRMLDPDPRTRLTAADARMDGWFREVVTERVRGGDAAVGLSDGETEKGASALSGLGCGGAAVQAAQAKARERERERGDKIRGAKPAGMVGSGGKTTKDGH